MRPVLPLPTQVTVKINEVPAACLGNCGFRWSDASTPTLSAVSPAEGEGTTFRIADSLTVELFLVDKRQCSASRTGSVGDLITLSGTKFIDQSPDDHQVWIGDQSVRCEVTSASETELQCRVSQAPAGQYDVSVNVGGKGLARHSGRAVRFRYTFRVTGVQPTRGSLGGACSSQGFVGVEQVLRDVASFPFSSFVFGSGGTLLTINGIGFGDNVQATLDGRKCTTMRFNFTHIVCVTPPRVSYVSKRQTSAAHEAKKRQSSESESLSLEYEGTSGTKFLLEIPRSVCIRLRSPSGFLPPLTQASSPPCQGRSISLPVDLL